MLVCSTATPRDSGSNRSGQDPNDGNFFSVAKDGLRRAMTGLCDISSCLSILADATSDSTRRIIYSCEAFVSHNYTTASDCNSNGNAILRKLHVINIDINKIRDRGYDETASTSGQVSEPYICRQ